MCGRCASAAGRWPVKGFTREENLRFIEGHEREHEAGEAFTYALLSPGPPCPLSPG
jgi:hypothetical protein